MLADVVLDVASCPAVCSWTTLDTVDSTMDFCQRMLTERLEKYPEMTLPQAVRVMFNDAAMTVGDDAAARLPLSVVSADAQTAGVGRLGRQWTNQRGKSFAGTFVVAMEAARSEAVGTGWLTTCAGLAVLDALQCVVRRLGARYEVPLGLKWPNDIFMDGRKLGGILSRTIAQKDGTIVVAFGIGLNLFMESEDLPIARATSLHEHVETPLPDYASLRDLLAALIALRLRERLETSVRAPQRSRSQLRQEALAESVTVGRPAHITLVDGRTFDAQAVDIDADGALVVRTRAGGTLTVTVGDVGID